MLANFWAAWCLPCAEEVPRFIALQKKYQGQGLQVIGFSVDDDAQELESFYRKYQMNYPVVPSDIKLADKRASRKLLRLVMGSRLLRS